MEINMDLETEVKSWLTSKTILGAVFAGLATIAGAVFKVELPDNFAADLASDIATLAGLAIVVYGRFKAVKKIK